SSLFPLHSSLLPAPCSLLPKNQRFVPHGYKTCYIAKPPTDIPLLVLSEILEIIQFIQIILLA
ncbi:MAG: hypothetical protein F6K50_21725, partial [Moorea sp. SIO3I7]|nr:hypothetical protein [Moorena sp. SIO3I7]